MDDYGDNTGGKREDLGVAPPRPPRSRQSIMSMAAGPTESGGGVDMSSPAVAALSAVGEIRNGFMKLSAILPMMAQPAQKIIAGLEAVVPQQVADLVAGNPAGSGGSGMGAPQAPAAPTAPPVQQGMP